MIPSVSTFNMGGLRSSADIIEEVDGITTYLGFCKPGTLGTEENQWSVLRITGPASCEWPKVTTFEWAGGSCAFNLNWIGRAGYDYQFKTF